MPNLYETGSGLTRIQVVDAVLNFAENTAAFTRLSDSPLGLVKYLQLDDIVYAFRDAMTEAIEVYITSDHEASDEWLQESVRLATPVRCDFWDSPGPYVNHWIFTDIEKQVVHVVIETTTNVFSHFSFGRVERYGVYTGGHYCTGHKYDNATRPFSPISSIRNKIPWESGSSSANGQFYHPIGLGGAADFANIGSSANGRRAEGTLARGVSDTTFLISMIFRNTPQQLNGQAVGLPIQIFVEDINNTLVDFPMGFVPGVQLVNMGDTILPKSLLLSNEWIVFPLSELNGDGTAAPNSFTHGLAYQFVVEG
ncbi:MAG: hypothetical protein K6L81_01975 [Agarilytica sp.]